jgi:hypothetical protein
MKTRFLMLVLLVPLLAWSLPAQRIDPAIVGGSGGFAQSVSGSVSWTVGQTAVQTWTTHAGTVSEGFQQAFLTVIPIRERSIPLSLSFYPNPARHSVLVTLSGAEEDLSLVLFNLLGEPVLRQELRSGDRITRLPFDALPSGLYMLAAFSGSGERLALYKIVKAN